MKELLHEADYVVYQSKFCKLSADVYLGERRGGWEILYNAVDTKDFHPNPLRDTRDSLIVLHAGSVEALYRFRAVALTLAELVRRGIDVKMIVAGRLRWSRDPETSLQEAGDITKELGIRQKMILLPPYSRSEAPSVFRRAHMLLHTKVYDPCPKVVLEAMASGLPVVYSRDGGVPELVGEHAGIGVQSHSTWEETVPPDPVALADAVVAVADRLSLYSEAARSRAVEQFDIGLWMHRHEEIFRNMLQT
jgi:glycosyltransferase involved in cell wall biosynthesis